MMDGKIDYKSKENMCNTQYDSSHWFHLNYIPVIISSLDDLRWAIFSCRFSSISLANAQEQLEQAKVLSFT